MRTQGNRQWNRAIAGAALALGPTVLAAAVAACGGGRAADGGGTSPHRSYAAGGTYAGGEAESVAVRSTTADMAAPPPAAEPVSAGARPAPAADGAGRAPDYRAGETYARLQENDFIEASEDAMSTFSLDVDTASYTIMRRDLRAGRLPRPESVRVEEYVNFFDYGDAPPDRASGAPFAVHLESAPSRFGAGKHLLRVGVQGMEIPASQRPAANLVFLVDVGAASSSGT